MDSPQQTPPPVLVSEADPARQGWWITTHRGVAGMILLVFSIFLVLTVLEESAIIQRSLVVAISMWLLAGIGVIAGVIGAKYRKEGRLDVALTAYRVAVWCLFFAFWGAAQYHSIKRQEDFIKKQEDYIKKFQEDWKKGMVQIAVAKGNTLRHKAIGNFTAIDCLSSSYDENMNMYPLVKVLPGFEPCRKKIEQLQDRQEK